MSRKTLFSQSTFGQAWLLVLLFILMLQTPGILFNNFYAHRPFIAKIFNIQTLLIPLIVFALARLPKKGFLISGALISGLFTLNHVMDFLAYLKYGVRSSFSFFSITILFVANGGTFLLFICQLVPAINKNLSKLTSRVSFPPKWGLLFISILGSLLFIEWGCRVVSPSIWSEASQWRWFASHVKRNQIGLRGSNFNPDIDGRHQVVILGDSFSFGFKVDQDKILAAHLRNKFKDRGFIVDVHNAAQINWALGEQAQFYYETAPLLKPKVVILTHVLNDIPPYNRTNPAGVIGLWCLYNVYSYNLIRPIVDRLKQSNFISDTRGAYTPTHINYDRYMVELSMLNDAVEKEGGQLLFVLFPWFISMDNYPFKQAHENLKNSVTSLNIAFIDLFDTYRVYKTQELIVSRTDLHPNALAHKLAADVIEAELFTNPVFKNQLEAH